VSAGATLKKQFAWVGVVQCGVTLLGKAQSVTMRQGLVHILDEHKAPNRF
jgi:hypothetical protein